MDEACAGYLNSEIGPIEVIGTEDGIISVEFKEGRRENNPQLPAPVEECLKQLEEYFRGKRRAFSIDLILSGTNFQEKVWRQLINIPFGETVSYKDIAASIGNANAVRAVGNANGRNRIPIIIPCHRVIASDGSLAGFGSGIWRKEWLLKHEKTVVTAT
jgi:methylated-DNA-[protein]-cysteine S-methyltransferase